MKTETNIVRYELEAGAFDWEIAPGKTIEAWGLTNKSPDRHYKLM